MYSKIDNYLTVSNFAKVYKSRGGKTGVQRSYIHRLIQKEIKDQGSTDIDVLEVDSVYFVRYRA